MDPDRQASRSENLLHQIEEDILGGRLGPGTRLDEKMLAERFRVSRTPVREALWHLAASGLVEMRRYQGAIVKQLTFVELVEMFQVMAELEGLCARLAAKRMTPAERKHLHVIHKTSGRHIAQGNYEGFFDCNTDLHEAIFVGSKNQFLIQESRSLRSRVNPYRRYITFQPGSMARTFAEHEAMIRAIDSGDADTAQSLMRDHVNLLGEVVSDFIASLMGQDVPVALLGDTAGSPIKAPTDRTERSAASMRSVRNLTRRKSAGASPPNATPAE